MESSERRVQEVIPLASALQSRLLSALDALDTVQIRHRRNINAIVQERDQFQKRLGEIGCFVQDLRSEHDDMRDAVMRLIEQVELCNDYSKWPHSQLCLSEFAESGPHLSAPETNRDEILSSAAITIAHLRKQRDDERLAHARYRETASSKILELEAQIYRREAQLELSIERLAHMNVVLPHEPAEGFISTLEITSARNKALESEVKALSSRLEQEKSRLRSAVQVNGESSQGTALGNRDETLPPRKIQDPAFQKSRTILGFEREVQALANKIDSFTEERQICTEMIQDPLGHADKKSGHLFNLEVDDRILELESECQRLQVSEITLRAELEASRRDALKRETELLSEITTLRLSMEQKAFGLQPSKQVPSSTSPIDLLGEGEISMELATPLMPANSMTVKTQGLSLNIPDSLDDLIPNIDLVSLSRSLPSDDTQRDNQDTPYIDPPSVPLPASPDGLSDWEENDNSPTLSEFMISQASLTFPPSDVEPQTPFDVSKSFPTPGST